MKIKCSLIETVYYQEIEIEASSPEIAENIMRDKWLTGELECVDSETKVITGCPEIELPTIDDALKTIYDGTNLMI